jgi:hypothetical protein
MAKKKEESVIGVISLRTLCSLAGIRYHRVYDNLRGTYSSLTHPEKTQIVNALYDGLSPFLKRLGFFMKIHPLKDQVPDQDSQKDSQEEVPARP